MAIVGFGWFVSPFLSLLLFLLGSAWHFGETECTDLGIRNSITQLIYGIIILSSIILPHPHEALYILSYLDISIPMIPEKTLSMLYYSLSFSGVALSFFHKSIRMLLSVGLLTLLGQLPLMYAFFIFFIFRHSASAWSHLRDRLRISGITLFIESLPFSIGAWILLSIWLYTWPLEQIASWFFVFLSCVTIPHIFCMTYMYNKEKTIYQSP